MLWAAPPSSARANSSKVDLPEPAGARTKRCGFHFGASPSMSQNSPPMNRSRASRSRQRHSSRCPAISWKVASDAGSQPKVPPSAWSRAGGEGGGPAAGQTELFAPADIAHRPYRTRVQLAPPPPFAGLAVKPARLRPARGRAVAAFLRRGIVTLDGKLVVLESVGVHHRRLAERRRPALLAQSGIEQMREPHT